MRRQLAGTFFQSPINLLSLGKITSRQRRA
jgi:hypothetical protein